MILKPVKLVLKIKMKLHTSCQLRASAVLVTLAVRNVLMTEVTVLSALLVVLLIIFPKTNSAKVVSSKVASNALIET